ncbi:sulfotransferase [Wenzhouxiangella sp. XN201]|uniref:sulfotransferase n=1 Tax=Wenzhouxiangella sp. XN201 TaxID=2710755 RepID=UPI0013C8A5B8|nr:sulfotransferase [Wenzhouxiangella sp. XN201]
MTTRGRWINPFVFSNLAVMKRLPVPGRVDRPIFITGTGRSGTTVLGLVLAMHHSVGFLNEPKAIWASLLSDEDLVGSYHTDIARYRFDSSDADELILGRVHRLYGWYSALSFSSRIVEKYPEMIFRVPFLKALFPDARFIFISRRADDTLSSIDQWSRDHAVETSSTRDDWWGRDGRKWRLLVEQLVPEHDDLREHRQSLLTSSNHCERAAVEWLVTMREGLTHLSQMPERVLHVSYEKLCRSPRSELLRITDFCSLDPEQRFVEYAESILTPKSSKPQVDLPAFLRHAVNKTQTDIDGLLS